MGWKSIWQIRRERARAQQSQPWYPPPPQFPSAIDASSFVELANKLLPEMRQHHATTAKAAKDEANGYRLERVHTYRPIVFEDLPKLIPADLATLKRWTKRRLFYAHYGQHRTQFTRETIYEDLKRTCGTTADWRFDLPTRLRDRDRKKAQRENGPDPTAS